MSLLGPGQFQSLADWVSEKNAPGVYTGQPGTPTQLELPTANYAGNLIRNGSVESWASGTTSVPDGWTLTGAGATIARNTTNVQRDLASVDVVAALNTATDLAQSLTISATQNTHLRGKYVTFSAQVKVGADDRAFLRIDDGIATKDSPFHVGDGIFRNLSVTKLIDASATKIECSCEIASGAAITATFDAMMLNEGIGPTAFNINAVDLLLVPRVVSATDSVSHSGGTTYEDIPNLSIANVIVNGRQSVHIAFTIQANNSGADLGNKFKLDRSGTDLGPPEFESVRGTGGADTLSAIIYLDRKPAAGNYTYKAEWAGRAATSTPVATNRQLLITIIPDE